ncbi:hypothetical protein, partial [Bradyrhizobium sacchari]|uniref:hypothetical protein n=1 Tax=Bradyrhizobium sacchari TaxID=1399419 RepID=UPI001AED114E
MRRGAHPAIGARKEYRTAPKPLAIHLDARRNGVSRFRALDHHHTHRDFLQLGITSTVREAAIGWTASLLVEMLVQPIRAAN